MRDELFLLVTASPSSTTQTQPLVGVDVNYLDIGHVIHSTDMNNKRFMMQRTFPPVKWIPLQRTSSIKPHTSPDRHVT